jgi:hypothetical protein
MQGACAKMSDTGTMDKGEAPVVVVNRTVFMVSLGSVAVVIASLIALVGEDDATTSLHCLIPDCLEPQPFCSSPRRKHNSLAMRFGRPSLRRVRRPPFPSNLANLLSRWVCVRALCWVRVDGQM